MIPVRWPQAANSIGPKGGHIYETLLTKTKRKRNENETNDFKRYFDQPRPRLTTDPPIYRHRPGECAERLNNHDLCFTKITAQT